MQADQLIRVARPPKYFRVIPYAATCFAGALLSDLAYWRTADMQWANFSIWLITGGLVVSGIAALVALTDIFGRQKRWAAGSTWLQSLGHGLAVVVSVFNAFVHSRDAYTSVVPTGMTLSAITVVLLVITAVIGRPRASYGAVDTSIPMGVSR